MKSWQDLEVDPGAAPSLPSPREVVTEDLIQSILQCTTFDEIDLAATQLYDEATGNAIAEEAVHVAGPSSRIALLYCPALFRSLKEAHPGRTSDELFDFDPRFHSLGNTTILPINQVNDIPSELRHQFSVVIADITQQGISLEESMKLAVTLTRLHEPLKVILVASKEIAGLGPEIIQSKLQPHCRGRADIAVFHSVGYFSL